jgi:Uma2 family endonuclease
MSAAVSLPGMSYAYSSPKLPNRITEAEYEALLEQSEVKLEFREGCIIAMAGGSDTHSLVKSSLMRHLGNALAGRPCRVYDSDMKVKVSVTGLNTFPDASIVCGKPEFKDERRLTLLNPGAIFEVMSPSTADYDRRAKFWHYEQLPSLRTYVLIATDSVRVEVMERDENNEWRWRLSEGLQATMKLNHYDVEIPLSSLYEMTELLPSN